MKRIDRVKILVCLFLFAFGAVAQAFSSGPVASRTGAPGEATCVDCHDEFELNRGSGRVDIVGLPKTYSSGERISVQVTVQQARQKKWGFQITALDSKGEFVGQFSITDTVKTQVINGNNRFYVEHTSQGTTSTQSDRMNWNFDWIAPSNDAGPVTFYVAGNAADADGSPLGDFIYTNVKQIGGPSDPEISLLAPNGGETVAGGKVFKINWSSKNATSHDILLQVNGSNDIPRTVVSGLSGSVNSFDWSVPNDISTNRARLIVVAQGRDGRSDSDSSDRDFSITPSQLPPGPTISSISVSSKKIKVTGNNLVAGTAVTVNGVGFSSATTISSTGKLIQKGTTTDGRTVGELIPVGVRVRMRFTNPNGGFTETDFVRQ